MRVPHFWHIGAAKPPRSLSCILEASGERGQGTTTLSARCRGSPESVIPHWVCICPSLQLNIASTLGPIIPRWDPQETALPVRTPSWLWLSHVKPSFCYVHLPAPRGRYVSRFILGVTCSAANVDLRLGGCTSRLGGSKVRRLVKLPEISGCWVCKHLAHTHPCTHTRTHSLHTSGSRMLSTM